MFVIFKPQPFKARTVDLRDPRKPQPPDVAQDSVLPWRSVMVMMVLLKDACTCAIASSTFLRTFLRAGLLPCAAPPCAAFCFWSAINYTLPGGAFIFTACLRGPLRVRALV